MDFLCFKIGLAARKIQKYNNNKFAEYGITVAQSFILFSLLESDGLNVKNLAEWLCIDSSAITALVDRLEKEHLIERRVDPEDRRALRIFLTDRGREIANAVYPIAIDFNEKLKENLAQEEKDIIGNFLNKIKDAENILEQ
jgi:DNA-binding MarR family transcriptional regulator